MELLNKMAAKSIIGNVKSQLPRDAEKNIEMGVKVSLFRVYGVARGLKRGESNFGPWTAFTGDFEAVKVSTGEVFRSSQLFLPEVAELMLVGPVMDVKNVGGVQFAFDIGAKGEETSVGYQYTCDALLEVSDNDPLAALKAILPAPRLAAPKQEEAAQATETKPATGKGKKQEAETAAA